MPQIERPTRQNQEKRMPITSAKMFGLMAAAAHGNLRGQGPSREIAEKLIHETSPVRRSGFAKALGRKRKRRLKVIGG